MISDGEGTVWHMLDNIHQLIRRISRQPSAIHPISIVDQEDVAIHSSQFIFNVLVKRKHMAEIGVEMRLMNGRVSPDERMDIGQYNHIDISERKHASASYLMVLGEWLSRRSTI